MDTLTNQIDFDNSPLKKSTILYVEDDEILREEISNLFKDFFKNVIVASNGEEAYEYFLTNKNKIDIILTDINMPKMNGVELISKIREKNQKIPILVCTAFNDSSLLVKIIKLSINDYILKPIQMMTTLKICHKILTNRNNELLVKKHLDELEDLKNIFEDENLFIEYDKDGDITYVNDLITEISGYSKEELIGQNHSILKHPDTSIEFTNTLWDTLNSGQKWKGKIKKIAKDGDTFFVKTTIIPIFDENKEIIKYLSIGYLITQEEEEKQHLKKMILQQKGEKLQIEKNIQKKVDEEVQKNIKSADNENYQERQKLLNLIYELDAEIKKLRSKLLDNNSRVLTLEHQLKDTNNRFDNMQIGYQKRVQSLNNTATLLAKKCEDLIRKNKLYIEKMEKSQESIKVLQTYIDEYREKIKNLEDVIESYEKDLSFKR